MALSGYNTPRTQCPVSPVDSDLDFTRTPSVHVFSGVLSDMDGTLIDSTDAIVKHWERIGKEYGIDPRAILASSHGRRSIDVFRQIDPHRATWAYVRELERTVPLEFGADAVEIPGARTLLTELEDQGTSWAIMKSGTRPLVEGWLRVLNLAEPDRMVTAEDVQEGKPNPECYCLGRKRLKADRTKSPELPFLVLEDAPAGIRAGKAAGCRVVAVATTHRTEELIDAGADWVVKDLTSICLKRVDKSTKELSIEIRDALHEGVRD